MDRLERKTKRLLYRLRKNSNNKLARKLGYKNKEKMINDINAAYEQIDILSTMLSLSSNTNEVLLKELGDKIKLSN